MQMSYDYTDVKKLYHVIHLCYSSIQLVWKIEIVILSHHVT